MNAPWARSPVLWVAVAVLGASLVRAQGDLRSSLRPITGPMRRAGVYHVATGTWTRNGSMSNLTGPDTIYSNTCTPLYFVAQATGERFQHRSRVPTTAAHGAPTTVNPLDPFKNDEAPGCDTDYLINGFEISYCSSRPSGLGTLEFEFAFADAYSACGAGNADMVPDLTIPVSGLPGGTSAGSEICWIVDVDLDAASAPFTLRADQDGTYIGPSTAEQFGFSIGPTTAGLGTSDMTGPVIAGNFTWTGGGPVHGAQVPCSGTDGTIWDSPINLAELGTGMASNDFFRATGTYPTPGCFYFGGAIHSDFYLRLFSDVGAPGHCSGGTGVQNCFPGTLPTTQGCPCGQPNNPSGGCANFGPGHTLGAVLYVYGWPSLSNDFLLIYTYDQRPTAVTNVFFTGSGSQNSGVVHGAGVRCVTTNLRRLYTGTTSGGSLERPGPGDPSISARCAALGVPISPGQTRHYFNIYRDPFAAGPCGNTSSTVNLTNASSATWGP
jgi:hypothetical protein